MLRSLRYLGKLRETLSAQWMSAANGSPSRPRSRSSRKDVHDARQTLKSRPSSQLLSPSGTVACGFVLIGSQADGLIALLMAPSSSESSSRSRKARSKSASRKAPRERSPNPSIPKSPTKSRATNNSRPSTSSRSKRVPSERELEQFHIVTTPVASSSKCERAQVSLTCSLIFAQHRPHEPLTLRLPRSMTRSCRLPNLPVFFDLNHHRYSLPHLPTTMAPVWNSYIPTKPYCPLGR